ncbi:MAG: MFS transporter [Bacillota bacterium]
MNYWQRNKRYLLAAVVVLTLFAAIAFYKLNYYINFNPFVQEYPLSLALNLRTDDNSSLWLIDDGSKRLTRVNSKFAADRVIFGGSTAFEQCDEVCADGNGGIYATNIFIKSLKERYHEQQIVQLDEHGQRLGVIYTTRYDKDNIETKIRALRVADGKLYFVEIDDAEVRLYVHSADSGKTDKLAVYKLLNSHWSAVAYDVKNARVIIAYKSGEIIAYKGQQAQSLLPVGSKYVPMMLQLGEDGVIYFFDAASQTVVELKDDHAVVFIDRSSLHKAFGDEFVFVTAATVDSANFYAVALNKVAVFSRSGGFLRLENIGISSRILLFSAIAWVSLALLCCAALGLLIWLYLGWLRRLPSQATQMLLLVLLPILVAAVFIISTISADYSANRYADAENRVKHLSKCLSQLVEEDTLKAAFSGQSYNSAAYQRLSLLIENFSLTKSAGDINFYTAVYFCDAGKLRCVIDSSDDFMLNYTMPKLAEYEYLFQSMETGEPVCMKVADREGGWLCSVYPIKDLSGKTIGLAEADCETSYIDFINQGDILFSLLKLISLIYVTFLLTYELSAYISAKQTAKRTGVSLRSNLLSTRTLSFCAFFCLRMIYGFMPLLVNRYPLAEYGIRYEFAVGLAFSLEYASVMLINSFAGNLPARVGWKPLVWLGVAGGGLAAVISYSAPHILIFYAGLFLSGFAVNMVYYGLDTRLSSEPDVNCRANFRPEQMSGVYSGTLCGLLVGLWLFERVSPVAAIWSTLVISLAVGIMIFAVMQNSFDDTSDNEISGNILLALKEIFKDIPARRFFLLMIIPGTMLLVQPLFLTQIFVVQNGYDLLNIGWSQMAAEFAIVYFGSRLFSMSLKKFSLKNTTTLGGALVVCGHLLAAAGYNLPCLYSGMLVVSFGFAIIHSSFAEYCLSFASSKIIGRQTMVACLELVMACCYVFSCGMIGQIFGVIGMQRGWLALTGIAGVFLAWFFFAARKSE